MSYQVTISGHDDSANYVVGDTSEYRQLKQRSADEHVVEQARRFAANTLRGVSFGKVSTSTWGDTDILNPKSADEQQADKDEARKQRDADKLLQDALYEEAQFADVKLPENLSRGDTEQVLAWLRRGDSEIQRPAILGKEDAVEKDPEEPTTPEVETETTPETEAPAEPTPADQ